MKVFVVNAGSSSLKYQLIDMEDETAMAWGIVERIGDAIGSYCHKKKNWDGTEEKTVMEQEIADHKAAMHLVIKMITTQKGVIQNIGEIDVIGHRVVQGGEAFTRAVLIDDLVKTAIRENNPLAPLHNPANLAGIEVAEDLFPGTPNVAVFDTQFHQTMPAKAYLYALPYDYYTDLKVRRYGFHGTSHKFVAQKAACLMGKKPGDINVITVHIGNGGSVTAVKKGECIDTSMGMTPLAGTMMGTRCGDIDPAIPGYIARAKNMSLKEVDSVLNKSCGLRGICGMNDMRDIHAGAAKGDEKAILAVEMFAYSVKKYIGSYYAALGMVDAVVFTAGIGENDDIVRSRVCRNMEGLGIEIDLDENDGRIAQPRKISRDTSRVQVWVIPTNEELQIAQESVEVVHAR